VTYYIKYKFLRRLIILLIYIISFFRVKTRSADLFVYLQYESLFVSNLYVRFVMEMQLKCSYVIKLLVLMFNRPLSPIFRANW